MHSLNQNRPEHIPEDRSAFHVRQIEAVKANVRIEDVAADYGEFRLQGAGRLLGRCVSPDHPDKTPSMTIFTDEQRFKCFGIGCGAHGDVLDLVMLAEKCELWVAMVDLAQRYGVELPGRPRSWYAKQERQAKTRNAIEVTKMNIARRRLFRHLILPLLDAIEDGDEHNRELDRAWADFDRLMR